MIRAALIALALAAPASAATTDLVMTIVDGRPAFRPADGLDCYTAKFGGVVIDCALADADLTRPRRAPCWIRPDLVGPCPVGAAVLAALPAARAVLHVVPGDRARRPGWTGGTGACCRTHDPHDPPPLAPVPLPAGGLLLLAAIVMMTALRGERRL